jgi:tetratricopeptide (TPR) repeat protein
VKLFKGRGRHEPAAPPSTPLDKVVALFKAGRYAEAEAEARAVAAAQAWQSRDTVGPAALSLAAMAIGSQGRHAEALAEYDALLPVFGETYGAEHLLTLKLRSDRAQTLIRLGRHAESAAECAAVARTASQAAGRDMQTLTAAARNGLAFALNAQGRHAEGEAVAREALAAFHDPGRVSLTLRLALARSLEGQARHEEALAETERAEVLRRDLGDGAAPETGAVEVVRAIVLLGQGRNTEARALAAAAHQACRAAFGPGHGRTTEARELLDRIDGTGRTDADSGDGNGDGAGRAPRPPAPSA